MGVAIIVFLLKQIFMKNEKKPACDKKEYKALCTSCKTGKKSYKIDKRSDMCPHINSWKDGTCHYYESMDE